jgi:hypothetical protein
MVRKNNPKKGFFPVKNRFLPRIISKTAKTWLFFHSKVLRFHRLKHYWVFYNFPSKILYFLEWLGIILLNGLFINYSLWALFEASFNYFTVPAWGLLTYSAFKIYERLVRVIKTPYKR